MILNVNTKPLNSYGVPSFTYTGTYEIVDDNNNILTDMKQKNWRIRFLTSGELTFTKLNGATKGIDVFIVGGGGKGGNNPTDWTATGGRGGGGGGKTNTQSNVLLTKNTVYTITIGSGSSSNYGTGGQSSAFDFSADGGESVSGGSEYGVGNGGDGAYHMTSGGNGVKEFGVGPSYYGGGGGGGAQWTIASGHSPGAGGLGGGGAGGTAYSGTSYSIQSGQHGVTNTGGGGGGAGGKRYDSPQLLGGNGGSGIVIIRNSRV